MASYIQKRGKNLLLFEEQVSVLDVRSFYYLKKELEKNIRNSDELLYNAGKEAVQKMQNSFVRFLGDSAQVFMSDTETALGEFINVLSLLGLGEISISKFNKGKSIKFIVEHSAEAQEYVNLKERSNFPACYAISGIFAGVCEMILRIPVECRETKCAAQGAGRCEFIIKLEGVG